MNCYFLNTLSSKVDVWVQEYTFPLNLSQFVSLYHPNKFVILKTDDIFFLSLAVFSQNGRNLKILANRIDLFEIWWTTTNTDPII